MLVTLAEPQLAEAATAACLCSQLFQQLAAVAVAEGVLAVISGTAGLAVLAGAGAALTLAARPLALALPGKATTVAILAMRLTLSGAAEAEVRALLAATALVLNRAETAGREWRRLSAGRPSPMQEAVAVASIRSVLMVCKALAAVEAAETDRATRTLRVKMVLLAWAVAVAVGLEALMGQ